ncbi:MAG TPA: hypothetical protein VLK24_06285 [Gaiellaceae bacterium]|nr:hypothetical protein [Gaiellaceae bacterium]
MKGRVRTLAVVLAVIGISAAAVLGATATTNRNAAAKSPAVHATSSGPTKCALRHNVKHVIYLIFDNVHFLRDNPNVPSDLEQMPHLLNFIRGNGTLYANDHTVLISHTANGILSSFTGVYSDRHGQAVANSYRYFRNDGSGLTNSSSGFKYWTDLTDDVNTPPLDSNPNMVTNDGGGNKNTPAPWVPYTRAGCDWGATASANVVLENTGTGPAGDMTKVFGSGSPEWNEAQTSNAAPANTAARNLAQTDFVGLAIHCAQNKKSICHGNANAKADSLPDEPGGYSGYQGIFGGKYVNPAICHVNASNCTNATINGQTALKKLDGTPITDQYNQPGFPGFDGLFASTTLSYIAQMQENGIPVTYGYISDAHDQHGVAGEIHATRGPGESDYVQQLHDYDVAFDQFFNRLAADGINKSNTLFVFNVEEGDHFAGAIPTPAGCDGVTVPCNYSLRGEINGNLQGLLKTQQGITTPFTIHSDMAPTLYLTGNPARTSASARAFGRGVGALRATNPYTGYNENITAALADQVEEKTLHMVTADPQRTPNLTMFALPDYFLFASSAPCDEGGATPSCITVPTTPPTSTFAWNHGGIQPEIGTTWLGLVGPGVKHGSVDSQTWADHTDTRPTMLNLVGLTDDYIHDGSVLAGELEKSRMPQSVRRNLPTYLALRDVYKQLNAPFGLFAMSTLQASTRAIKSGSASDDSRYNSIEDQIAALTTSRDILATSIRNALDGLFFTGAPLSVSQANSWIAQANALIVQARAMAGST